MTRVPVAAKINLALLVGERREDGLHDVATVLQRVDLCDWLELGPAPALSVEGFSGDTLVRSALTALARAAGVEPRWRAVIEKHVPLAAGLGGGSADAAATLRLANETLPSPLPRERLLELAAGIGSDVPFFLHPGPKLAEGAGERLRPLELPQDFWVVIAFPRAAAKPSTAEVYARYDALGGGAGFAERRAALLAALEDCKEARDLGGLPPNDLAAAAGRPALLDALLAAGAFRADVSGAGPSVYGLFLRRSDAEAAVRRCRRAGRVWLTAPVW